MPCKTLVRVGRDNTWEHVRKKSARFALPTAYVGGSTPPAVLNENSLPISSNGCVIIFFWYVCRWKIGKYAHRKIISNALDWKSSNKNNYNIKLGFLLHITYSFLPKEGIRAHKKGKEENWCFLLDVGIKTCVGAVLADFSALMNLHSNASWFLTRSSAILQ